MMNGTTMPTDEFFGGDDASDSSRIAASDDDPTGQRTLAALGGERLDGPALATEDPPLEYIIAALGMTAGSGAPHMFAGYGFSGKTLLAQALALAMAAGRPAWGGLTCRRGRVVHVDLEQGRRLTKRRYRRLAVAMGVDLATLDDALVVYARPSLRLGPEDRAKWLALMHGRDVIIIDSWRAACPGVDENSSDVRATLDMLGELSEQTGCRAILIHHARKPSGDQSPGAKFGVRGSSGFYDGTDALYVFAAEKGEPVVVSCEKAREHGELTDTINVEIVDVAGDHGPKTGLALKLYGAERAADLRREAEGAKIAAAVARARPLVVSAIVRASTNGAPFTSIDELRASVGHGKPVVQRALREAIEAGDVHHVAKQYRPGRAPTVATTTTGPSGPQRTESGPISQSVERTGDRYPRRSRSTKTESQSDRSALEGDQDPAEDPS